MSPESLAIAGLISFFFWVILIPFSADLANALRKIFLFISFLGLFIPYLYVVHKFIWAEFNKPIIFLCIMKCFIKMGLAKFIQPSWENGFLWGILVSVYISSFIFFFARDSKFIVIRKDKCPKN